MNIGQGKTEQMEDKQLLKLLGEAETPEPSANMEHRFQGMLEHYKQSQTTAAGKWKTFAEDFLRLFSTSPKLQLSYSLALILIGLGVGYMINLNQRIKTSPDTQQQLSALSSQLGDMRHVMILALIKAPSASERLKAVNYAEKIDAAGEKIINALFATLNADPNINVRLLTLDALTKYTDEPTVRARLIQSIPDQQSPLMQSALADVMLKLQEKQSIPEFKELLKRKKLNKAIRDKITNTMHQLSI